MQLSSVTQIRVQFGIHDSEAKLAKRMLIIQVQGPNVFFCDESLRVTDSSLRRF